MEMSILVAVSQWLVKNLKIDEALKNTSTEILEKCLWSPLKKKIINYFSSENEAQMFVERISTTKAVNVNKPVRDIEDIYQEQNGIGSYEELFNAIVEFFQENQHCIKQINGYIADDNRRVQIQNATTIINNEGAQHFTLNYK